MKTPEMEYKENADAKQYAVSGGYEHPNNFVS